MIETLKMLAIYTGIVTGAVLVIALVVAFVEVYVLKKHKAERKKS